MTADQMAALWRRWQVACERIAAHIEAAQAAARERDQVADEIRQAVGMGPHARIMRASDRGIRQ